MTNFHKGQNVEVRARPHMWLEAKQWVKATVVYAGVRADLVEFPDGEVKVFLHKDVRAIEPKLSKEDVEHGYRT